MSLIGAVRDAAQKARNSIQFPVGIHPIDAATQKIEEPVTLQSIQSMLQGKAFGELVTDYRKQGYELKVSCTAKSTANIQHDELADILPIEVFKKLSRITYTVKVTLTRLEPVNID